MNKFITNSSNVKNPSLLQALLQDSLDYLQTIIKAATMKHFGLFHTTVYCDMIHSPVCTVCTKSRLVLCGLSCDTICWLGGPKLCNPPLLCQINCGLVYAPLCDVRCWPTEARTVQAGVQNCITMQQAAGPPGKGRIRRSRNWQESKR